MQMSAPQPNLELHACIDTKYAEILERGMDREPREQAPTSMHLI